MNILIQKTFADEWLELNQQSVIKQRAFLRSRFSSYKKKIANKPITLRNIAAVVNKFPVEEAFNICASSIDEYYKSTVENSSILALAGKPLYYLYDAPKAKEGDMPYFASSQVNQCYIKESFFAKPEARGKLLICTTSRTHTLSMPLSVFHSYASKHFDAILYYFDPQKNHYKGQLDSLRESAEKIIQNLQPSVTSFIGTSAGSCPAINLYLENKRSRVIAGSPVFDMHPEITKNLLKLNKELLKQSFIATYADNQIDSRFKKIYAKLTQATSPTNILNMSKISPSHASLGSTLITKEFDKLLGWLSNCNPAINN